MTPFCPRRVAALLKNRPVHLAACGLVLLLWILLVLPSAFLNGLFTLDLGDILTTAAEFPANLHSILLPYTHSGRYFPLYWLYHILLFRLFGVDLTAYYLAVAVIALIGALLTTVIFASIVRNTTAAVLFTLTLFISSPNVESVYTIGKAEPIIYLFLSIIFLLLYYGHETRSILRCIVTTLAFLFALWFKETALAVFTFALTGLIATFVLCKHLDLSHKTQHFQQYGWLFLSLCGGYGLSRLPYLIFTRPRGAVGYYTNFSPTFASITKNLVFYLTQQPDVSVLGLLAFVFLILVLKRALSPATRFDARALRDLIFVISLFVMGWAYLGALLLWRWPMSYYLYVPAIVFRLAAAYGLYMIVRLNLAGRSVRVSTYIVLSVLCVNTAVYLWYSGSSQIRYSRVYTNALRDYVSKSADGDSLVIESYPFFGEQVFNTWQLLNRVFATNRRVFGIADLVNPAVVTPEMRQLLLLTDARLAANEDKWPKKNDVVMVVTGNELATWQVRGVGPWYSDGSFLQTDGSYDLEIIGGGRSYFPSAYISVWTHHLDFAQTFVGYELYRVIRGPRFTWLGRYPDGWMGRRARLALYPEYVGSALVHVSTSKYNSPNSVSLFQDNVFIDTVVLSEGKAETIRLKPVRRNTPTVFRFEVTRTFIPAALRMNRDQRELGAMISVEPFAAGGK